MSALLAVEEHPAEAAAGLWARVVALAEGLGDGDWGRPVPWCPRWDVKDLLAHLAGIQTAFDGTAEQPGVPDGWTPPEDTGGLDHWTEAGVAARRGRAREQVLEELRVAAAGHEARLRAVADWEGPADGPLGPTTEGGLYAVRSFDVWAHLQDLREALGRPPEATDASPAALVACGFVLDLVPLMYAKRVEAPEGSALRLRLTGAAGLATAVVLRGGRAAFDAAAGAGGQAVEAAPGAFTLLLSGRGEPERWHEAGALRWQGDVGERFVRRARLFA